MNTPDKPAAVLPPIRDRFRALAYAIVPETAGLDPDEWADLEAIVENALSKRPPGMRRQLVLFIRLLDFLPRFRWLRPFRKLDADRRARFLRSVQSSPIFLFRRGFWGLRTLVYMGYYARPAAYRAIGYDAHLRGWLEHPDADEAARTATRRGDTESGGSSRETGFVGPDPAPDAEEAG
ncbi:MAG: hypothetical protein R3314_12165 [Longimicrobiales bacterium]|nr:hypothetical protein [Longimicrobiales bacterium]